jgi:redox-sensitive bicupin YhaK (pirin superfamily)
MKTIIHRNEDRGHADHGWLRANHSFSFASYFDKTKIQFGALRVLNDDTVSPSMGFSTHAHDNMEIVTIPLSGAVKHKDSSGGEGVIESGDVQIMSAGSGIRHSEYNASHYDMLNLLQIWIFPKERNIVPRYDQKTFFADERVNKFQTIVSPEKSDATLLINQDAWLSLAEIEEGMSVEYRMHNAGNGVYAFVIDGELAVADDVLHTRDAIGVSDTNEITLRAKSKTSVLMIEVPMLYA